MQQQKKRSEIKQTDKWTNTQDNTKEDVKQGRSGDGGYIGIYTLPKSGQVNFLWSNNDNSMYYVLWNTVAIKILYLPKTDFWLRPWCKVHN